MRFSQEFIERVRESSNIVDIISRYTELKRSGPNRWVGLCPFHNERSPSFSVSEQMQMYHCFGCKKGGNVYTFVQEIQGLSFPEAVEYLAQQASLPIPQEAYESGAAPDPSKRDHKKILFRINDFAAKFYHQALLSLPASHKVRDYIKSRGLKDETVKQFQLGYAPESWDSFVSACRKHQVPLAEAESLGLIKSRSGEKTGHYDLFRDRLMFPIIGTAGQTLGFGGRILGEGQPKYLNSPESEIFHKGRVFYGLDQAAKYIRTSDRVIVVEGYMDFLALFQAGIHDVVATLGTALTPDHARALKRHTKNVVVLFDGDSAGQDAALRSLPILLQEGLLPRGLILPDEEDPDEFLEGYGTESLKKLIAEAPELFVLIFDQKLKGFRGEPAQQVTLMDEMQPLVESVSDPRLKSLYIKQIAERLKVTPHWVNQALNPKGAKPAEPPRRAEPQRPNSPPKPSQGSTSVGGVGNGAKIIVKGAPVAGVRLLNVALMKVQYFQKVMADGELEKVTHAGLRQLWQRAVELYGQMPNKFDSLTACLISEVEPPEVVSLHLGKPLSELQDQEAEKLITDYTKYLKDQRIRLESKDIVQKMRQGKFSDDSQALEQIMNIHRVRHGKNKENV